MLSQLGALFDPEGFIPHGHCYLWLPEVLWLHVIADAIITLSYFTIPFALAYFVKRRTDLPFKSAFVMFGLFIMLCGFTHVLGIVTIWTPIYWIEGVVKASHCLCFACNCRRVMASNIKSIGSCKPQCPTCALEGNPD